MKFLKYIFIILVIVSSTIIRAQDLHFSQVLNFPLLINPAFCGQFDGNTRLIGAFRNQNLAVPNTAFTGVYNTFGASVDTKIFQEFTGDNTLSIGMHALSDYAGTGTLATNDLLATISYSIALDKYGQSFLSGAMQGGFTSRRIFSNDLLFETQVKEYSFDPTLPNLEKYIDGNSHIVPTYSLGLLYQQGFSENAYGQFGFSIYNLNRSNDFFNMSTASSLYSRINFHAGVAFNVDESMLLYPSIIYMKQGSASQINIGLSLRKDLTDDLKLLANLRTRLSDAIIIGGGIQYQNFQITASYDYTTSSLTNANKSSGAMELIVAYILGQNNKEYSATTSRLYCPNF